MNRNALLLAAAVTLAFAAASRADEAAAPDAAPPSPAAAVAPPAAPSTAATAPDSKADTDSGAQPADDDTAPPAAAPPPPPAPKAEPKPAAKSEEKPAPAAVAAAPAAPAAPAVAAKPAEKPLNSCAAKLSPVADSYLKAHDDMVAWLRAASAKMDAADGRIADLKKMIAEKEARITQLKLDSASSSAEESRTLDQEAHDLWSKLKTEQDSRKELCRALSSAAGREIRTLNSAVLAQFDKTTQSP